MKSERKPKSKRGLWRGPEEEGKGFGGEKKEVCQNFCRRKLVDSEQRHY